MELYKLLPPQLHLIQQIIRFASESHHNDEKSFSIILDKDSQQAIDIPGLCKGLSNLFIFASFITDVQVMNIVIPQI